MLSSAQHKNAGLTLIEVIIGVFIMAIILTALFTFVSRFFSPPRAQYQQGRITEDARNQLERMSDEIRGAVRVDVNGNGQIDDSSLQEQWLQLGDDNELTFYRESDDNKLDQVRYYLSGANLMRDISTVEYGSCVSSSPTTVTLARSLQNEATGDPMFTYYAGLFQLSTPVANRETVDRIELNLVVDSDINQEPEPVIIATDVFPRGGISKVPLPSGGPGVITECNDCVDNDGDGGVDFMPPAGLPLDFGCGGAQDDSEFTNAFECDDGNDNDGDGRIDFRVDGSGDPSCVSAFGTNEFPPGCWPGEFPPLKQCFDGADNDCDGKIDGAYNDPDKDIQCLGLDDNNEAATVPQCNDGFDNNSNGLIDLNDFGCFSISDSSEFFPGFQ